MRGSALELAERRLLGRRRLDHALDPLDRPVGEARRALAASDFLRPPRSVSAVGEPSPRHADAADWVVIAIGRDDAVVDVRIRIGPERLIVVVGPERVIEDVVVGVGPKQAARPANETAVVPRPDIGGVAHRPAERRLLAGSTGAYAARFCGAVRSLRERPALARVRISMRV